MLCPQCNLRKKSISEGKLRRKYMTVQLAEEVIKLWFKVVRVGFIINSYAQTRRGISKYEPDTLL